jgi:hypothetical protein
MRILRSLGPALDLLAENVKVLPAVGGAVEYLQRPDADEIDDALVNQELDLVNELAETRPPGRATVNVPVPPIGRRTHHLFRFFLDGSLRTYFLGTGIEGNRDYPIMIAQIGASCIHRRDDGTLTLFSHRTRVLLLLPKGGNGVSDEVWDNIVCLNAPDGSFTVEDTNQRTSHTRGRDIDLRTRGGGIARHRMHLLEVDLIGSTDADRSAGSWAILDGAVKLDKFIEKPHLIGVAKSFSKKPEFRIGATARSIDVTGLLAGLDYAHRTPAFASHGGKVAFWYVRLWEQKELDYPLMGVLKVELPTPDAQPADTDLVDELSRALVAERSVTPYGKDQRWHCHLYPIFCAERAIKEQFMSQEVLMGHVRWGRRPG